VNTASALTRGFVNAMKWGRRAANLGREAKRKRDKGIATVSMVDPLNPENFDSAISQPQ